MILVLFWLKRTFKGYSEEHRMIELTEFITLSGNTVSGRFSIDWTKTFRGIKLQHRKQDCLDCDNVKTCCDCVIILKIHRKHRKQDSLDCDNVKTCCDCVIILKIHRKHRKQDSLDCDNVKICCDCVIKLKMNCFNCEMVRDCETCLDRISQKRAFCTEINMLKRKPANDYYQMLPYYIGEYELKQIIIHFESAREILTKEDMKMVVKRRFERICIAIENMTDTKYEDILENKELFIYGFKQIKTHKVDIYILIGCESDELYENDKLLSFWCNIFINKEIEKRGFKITRWSFMTLVERNNFFKTQSIVCSWMWCWIKNSI